jgi:DNA-binding GntR family transcriptional regulator
MSADQEQPTIPLAERALRTLRGEILAGTRPPGSPLSEKSLASELGMSRTPIRAALKTLQQEGLAVVGGRRLLEVTPVTPEGRSEVVSLRVAIETVVVRRLCELRAEGEIEPDQLDGLRLLLLKQRRAAKEEDAARFFELDEELHLALASLSGLPNARRFLFELGGFVRLQRIGLPASYEHMSEITREHEELIEAIELADGDGAVALATRHMLSTAARSAVPT